MATDSCITVTGSRALTRCRISTERPPQRRLCRARPCHAWRGCCCPGCLIPGRQRRSAAGRSLCTDPDPGWQAWCVHTAPMSTPQRLNPVNPSPLRLPPTAPTPATALAAATAATPAAPQRGAQELPSRSCFCWIVKRQAQVLIVDKLREDAHAVEGG